MTSHRVLVQALGSRLFFGLFPTKVNLKRDMGSISVGAAYSSNGRTSDLYNVAKASGFDGLIIIVKTRDLVLC